MRVAIIGSTGQLGSELVRILSAAKTDILPLSHAEIEVSNLESVQRTLEAGRPDAVLNCAAFHRVDACEDTPDRAFLINAVGAHHVARVCARLDAYCVFISTDYVFDGHKGRAYVESDPVGPLNVYGASKVAGEQLTRQGCSRSAVVRISSLFGRMGARAKGGNFVDNILKKAHTGEPLRVVDDIRMTPTYARDAADFIGQLVEKQPTGLLHLTNRGECTWFSFAKKILELAGLSVPLVPIPASSFYSKAGRPVCSALRSERLVSILGSTPRAWEDALADYLRETATAVASAPITR